MYNKHNRHKTTHQGNNMIKKTNRSPYEIRADLLVLAKEILVEQAQANAERNAEGAIIKMTAPTTKQIIEEARALNQFVSLDDKGL
jgi:hypothetical protein